MLPRFLASDRTNLDEEESKTGSNSGGSPGKVHVALPSWLGRRVVCTATIDQSGGDGVTILAPHRFAKGQFVWLDGAAASGEYVVSVSERVEDRFRMVLRHKRERRRAPRQATSFDGRLRWLDGLATRTAAVRVLNLSRLGAQVRLAEPGPERGQATLTFEDRSRDCDVRYSIPSGEGFLMGVEFRD